MGNIGVTEILLIALVALLLFGAGRIADIGKGLGQGIKNFKQGIKEAEDIGSDKKDEPRGRPEGRRRTQGRPRTGGPGRRRWGCARLLMLKGPACPDD